MKQNIYDFPDRPAIEEEAGKWLIRLDGDKPLSADEQLQLKEWLSRSAKHKSELISLAEFWGKMNVLTELAVPLSKPEVAVSPSVRYRRFTVAMATVVLCLVTLVSFYKGSEPLDSHNTLYATAVGQQQTISLSDGSVVQLNTNSQIEVNYNEQFRDVYLLQGEGHFKVAKNTALPFRVYAGDGMIQAIGTAFSVHLDAKDVNVMVTEGRVALASIDEKDNHNGANLPLNRTSRFSEGIKINTLGTLDAGQSAKMQRVSQSSVTDSLEAIQIVEQPELERRLSWRDGLLVYAGESLQEVVADVSRYTTVSIEIMDEEVESIKIGGRFRVGETDVLFDVLEENFGLRIKHVDRNHVQLFAARE